MSGAMRPVPEMYPITQTFYANATIYNYGAGHGDIDYSAPVGTAILAPEYGVIRHADAGYERAIQVADERGVNIPMHNDLAATRQADQ